MTPAAETLYWAAWALADDAGVMPADKFRALEHWSDEAERELFEALLIPRIRQMRDGSGVEMELAAPSPQMVARRERKFPRSGEPMWYGFDRLPHGGHRAMLELMRCVVPPEHGRWENGRDESLRATLGVEFDAGDVARVCGVSRQAAEATLDLLVQHGFVVYAPFEDARYWWPDYEPWMQSAQEGEA